MDSDPQETETATAEAPKEQDELPMTNVLEPLDTDVLCGRGGAALRHPGNKTYRTLVQLNKGLYITCIKSEKLKISKSIVAAIREQKGRFLEKNEHGTYDDIGEKKAVEKTSQALREGQPKLKRQIAELGGSAAAAMAQNQGYSAAAPAGAAQRHHSYSSSDGNLAAAAAAAFAANEYNQYEPPQQQPPVLDEATASAFRNHRFLSETMAGVGGSPRNSLRDSMEAMPPPSMSPNHTQQNNNNNMGDMVQQFSMSNIQEEQPNVNRMRPSMLQRGSLIAHELGVDPQSSRSLMSDFSNFGMAESVLSMEVGSKRSLVGLDLTHPNLAAAAAMEQQQQQQQQPEGGDSQAQAAAPSTPMDRRRFFAKMKFNRPASGRAMNNMSGRMMNASGRNNIDSTRSFGDGMPDFHLVDSQMSLYSNMSSIGEPGGETSRRSIMSGLSKISDTEDANSIFSDLSKKIGNVSTRSMAMSEISNMEDLDDSVDSPPDIKTTNSSPPQPMTSSSMDFE